MTFEYFKMTCVVLIMIAVTVFGLSACDRLPEVAEKYDVLNHPFYGEVSYGWRYDADRCVVYLKTGKRATVMCRALERL